RSWLREDEDNSVDSNELTATTSPAAYFGKEREAVAAVVVASHQQQQQVQQHQQIQQQRDSNASVKSAKTSLAELGGRHTAARARAWASKQKDRMFSAFGSSSSNHGNNNEHALDPPPALRLHHQSHSAANLHISGGRPAAAAAGRHGSTDSLY
ncbi:hypothetical protein GGH95_003388, partial [Coemansia sp. RSA 1836]